MPENVVLVGRRCTDSQASAGHESDRVQQKRGRKPAGASRATEIRERLLAWRQTPEPQRISLRALAIEVGTSHQLLSFHLRRLHKWQMKGYEKKAQEIHARAVTEHRPMSREEQDQCIAYSRASLVAVADSVACGMLRELGRQIKTRALLRTHVRIAKLLARRGHRKAQEILDVHYQHKNNLPVKTTAKAKSFRTDTAKAGNSAKVETRALA